MNRILRRSIHTKIAIVGGGSGGSIVASHLHSYGIAQQNNITVFEPAKYHFFQSFMSKLAVGIYKFDPLSTTREIAKYSRKTEDIFIKKANLITERITQIIPSENKLLTNKGEYTYDVLILATGLQTNFSKYDGMVNAKSPTLFPNAGSLYDVGASLKYWDALQKFKSGSIVFMQGPPPLKCTGATVQIALLTEEYLRKKGIHAKLTYVTAGESIFPNAAYNTLFVNQFQKRNIEIINKSFLKELKENKAIFQNKENKLIELPYDLFHAVPSFDYCSFLPKELLNEKNLIEVNKYTLQHVRYQNIFALGDSSSIPVFKTAASIMYQSPILVNNVGRYLGNNKTLLHYDGHSICPVLINKGKAVFAETVYESKPVSRFLRNPVSASRMYYFAEVHLMKYIYLDMAINGRWYGTNLIIRPTFK